MTLRAAAAVQLHPLDTDAVRDYLSDDAAGPAMRARWAPVLAVLGTEAPAAQALSTPLMVGLARAIYNPRPGESAGTLRDPRELCDPALPDRRAVESLLFDAFIPAAYRHDPGGRWKTQDAEKWLVFLARHLERKIASPDLAWWQLRRAMPRTMAGVAGGVVFGVVFGVLGGVVVGVAAGPRAGVAAAVAFGVLFGAAGVVFGAGAWSSAESPARGMRIIIRRFVVGVVVGIVAGVVVGVVFGVAAGAAGMATGPAGKTGVLFGIAGGVVFGAGAWSSAEAPARGMRIIIRRFVVGAAAWIAAAAVFGDVLGIVFAVLFGAAAWSSAEVPARGMRISVPRLAAGVVLGTVFGAVFAIGAGFVRGVPDLVADGIAVGIAAGLIVGLKAVPGNLAEATSPRTVLARDRRAAFLFMLVLGVVFGGAAGAGVGDVFGGAGGVVFGIAVGAAAGVWLSTSQAAWPPYLLTMGWLAFSHRLPWSLMGFLADAHQRGILRQAGAVYQFRHIDLQHRLATRS